MDRTLSKVQKHNVSTKNSFPEPSLISSSPVSLIEMPSLSNQENKSEGSDRITADTKSKNTRDIMHSRDDNYFTTHLNINDEMDCNNKSKELER